MDRNDTYLLACKIAQLLDKACPQGFAFTLEGDLDRDSLIDFHLKGLVDRASALANNTVRASFGEAGYTLEEVNMPAPSPYVEEVPFVPALGHFFQVESVESWTLSQAQQERIEEDMTLVGILGEELHTD